MARILVSDDEGGARQVLRFVLLREKHDVSVAAGGRHTLALLEHNKFDLLITDMRNCHMSGIALAAEVNRLYPGMPIMVASVTQPVPSVNIYSQGDRVLESHVSEVGVKAYVTKPFYVDDILEAARYALHASGSAPMRIWPRCKDEQSHQSSKRMER